jgi:uncharacterized protein YjiS (DUF1127 family)
MTETEATMFVVGINRIAALSAPRMIRLWREFWTSWERRRGRRQLVEMSERELRDIGLVSADVWAELQKPPRRLRPSLKRGL